MEEKKFDCRKGCSFCCHIRPQVSQEEVPRLIEAFKKLPNQHKSLERALARQIRGCIALLELAPCVALGDDGACMIYEDRPMMCRAYHSTSAEACSRQDYSAIVKDEVKLGHNVAYLDEVYLAWKSGQSTDIAQIYLIMVDFKLYHDNGASADINPKVFDVLDKQPRQLGCAIIANGHPEQGGQYILASTYSRQIGIEKL